MTDHGGQIRVTPRVQRDLAAAGVDRTRLNRIAGGDHVISGAEFNRLFDAIATRQDGDRRASVSESTFASLHTHVERSRAGRGGDSPTPTTGGGRSVGIGGPRAPRPGQPSLNGSADIASRTDGDRPSWIERVFQAIAEFFVELFGGNYTTWDESQEELGHELARQHPESLRALLAMPNGEQRLRQHMLNQRPEGADEGEWSTTVDLVIRGMRAELSGGADLPDNIGRNASFSVRDAATPLYAENSSPRARRELDATLNALASSGLSEETQVALLGGGRPAELRQNLETLATALSSASPSVREAVLAEINQTPSRLGDVATLAGSLHSGTRAPLNDVLFGDRTLAEGASGDDVRVAQRYLRALRFDGTVGATVTGNYDANTRAAVEQFQRRAGLLDGNPPAAQAGVLNQATLRAMVGQLRSEGLDPTAYRFTTELSLNRPTPANDRPWRATQRWTPALQAEFRQFADAYVRARIPQLPNGDPRNPEWHERVDCANLSYEALVMFARQRGLPVRLRGGSNGDITHRTARTVAAAHHQLGAAHIRRNTSPVLAGQVPQSGDLGNMDWDQSVGNSQHGDNRYMHSYNIVEFDPLYRSGTVVYGSLDDLVADRALEQFNQRGFDLTIHDIPESTIIDAINDDSGGGRQQTLAEQQTRVRRLLGEHTAGSHQVTDADVNAFIAMISNDRNIRRNRPTAVRSGAAWPRLVTGEPWADPTARAAAVRDLNQRFGSSFTEADIDSIVAAGGTGRRQVDARIAQLVRDRVPAGRRSGARAALAEASRGAIRYHLNRDHVSDRGMRRDVITDFRSRYGARLTDGDLAGILRASGRDTALTAARGVLERRGLSGDRLDTASRELRDAVDETRRLRQWDFNQFNTAM